MDDNPVREASRWVSRRPLWVLGAWLMVYVVGVLVTSRWAGLSPSESIYFWTGVVLVWYAVETHATRKVITQQVDSTRASVDLARDAFKLNLLEVYRQSTAPIAAGAGRLKGPPGELMQAMAMTSHRKLYERLVERTFPEAIAELRALEHPEGGEASR